MILLAEQEGSICMEYKAAAYTRDRRAVVYLPPEEYTGYIPVSYTHLRAHET